MRTLRLGLVLLVACADSDLGSDTGALVEGVLRSPPECGGIAGETCPVGLDCVDDPSDDCDPARGDADCGGVCKERDDCGRSTGIACPAGLQWPEPPIACGGFAEVECPAGLACVDDPRDDCDPAVGGADCIGICVQL